MFDFPVLFFNYSDFALNVPEPIITVRLEIRFQGHLCNSVKLFYDISISRSHLAGTTSFFIVIIIIERKGKVREESECEGQGGWGLSGHPHTGFTVARL